jgi:carbamoyltransferase
MNILGLSFFYHDSGAALLVDGVPTSMSSEERFTRKKNDSDFPKQSIDFVLQDSKVKKEEIDYVVFYEKPFVKFERIIKTSLATFPSSCPVFIESIKHIFLDKMWIRQLISSQLDIDPDKILFSDHHLSHAASSFYCSPYDKAAILTVDGVGEWATTTLAFGKNNNIKVIKEIDFPHSLGLLYSAFTAWLGFRVNSGEYKVMGMAPYGKPKHVDKIKKVIKVYEDGSYALDLSYFTFHKSLTKTYSRKFVKLFGEPREKESKFFTRDTGWPSYFGTKPEGKELEDLANKQEYYADMATSIQVVLEEILIKLANSLYKETGVDKLCISGGVGLNSVANWKILQNTPFNNIYIQPAAGDAGGALGAALAAYHGGLQKPRTNFVMDHAYYGQEFDNSIIKKTIQKNNLQYDYIDNLEVLLDKITDHMVDGRVIGWYHGKCEWGPRALGSRSIVADPRREEMKDIVNTKIKFREPYRPFAPSVMSEHVEEFFDMPNAKEHYPGRFMLYVVPVKEDKKKIIPAITHVDGSARPQIVFQDQSPRYWQLINSFYKKTGVALVLNTSFNLRGEPIVNTPQNAINTFLKGNIDILVLEDYIVYRP